MLSRVLFISLINLLPLSFCFANEVASPAEQICADSEDRAPCRYTDDEEITRSGNCFDQVCVPHCPADTPEGSECLFIIGTGEERQGTCDEGLCSNLMEISAGMEASAGESNGGQSLSDFLNNTENGEARETEEGVEGTNENEVSSEDEGCQQSNAERSKLPMLLLCLVALGMTRRHSTS